MGRGKRQATAAREISLSDTLRAPKRVPDWDFSPKSRLDDEAQAAAEIVATLCRFRTLVMRNHPFHEALEKAAGARGQDSAERQRLGQAVLDLLDTVTAECYSAPKVEGASDLGWSEQAEMARHVLDDRAAEVIECDQCQQPCSAALAHDLSDPDQPFFIGDECCFDQPRPPAS